MSYTSESKKRLLQLTGPMIKILASTIQDTVSLWLFEDTALRFSTFKQTGQLTMHYDDNTIAHWLVSNVQEAIIRLRDLKKSV